MVLIKLCQDLNNFILEQVFIFVENKVSNLQNQMIYLIESITQKAETSEKLVDIENTIHEIINYKNHQIAREFRETVSYFLILINRPYSI